MFAVVLDEGLKELADLQGESVEDTKKALQRYLARHINSGDLPPDSDDDLGMDPDFGPCYATTFGNVQIAFCVSEARQEIVIVGVT
ncbi:hypothetical protein [Sinorhizobium meliloti]|uniref:hypothetical protein n=1 Tax=Rhizobium meliloti TaxID=382 RepID=UPI000FDB014C|nr:hypothetical protein [Sinorhizobium meliloti]RVK16940.1 hypothetical protein CN164_03240 [Sinorhizobium meliloti]